MPVLMNAQTNKQDSARRLSDLEVVADAPEVQFSTLSRSNVPLEKLPISVSTLDMSQLSDRNLFEVKDALRFVPAATMRQTYGAFCRFDVRGFSDQPVMVDGLRNERSTWNSYPMSDLSDVERVEILKGPASVLQGHSSIGGVLNIVRRQATEKTSLGLRLDYGSWNNIYSVLSFGGKLSKHWNGLAVVSYGKKDGWRSVNDKRFKVYGTLSGHWANDKVDIRASYNNDYYATETGLPDIHYTDIYNTKDGSVFLKSGEINPNYKRDARYNNESDFMYHKDFNLSMKWQHTFSDFLKLNEYISFDKGAIDYFSSENLLYKKGPNAPNAAHYYLDKNGAKVPIDLGHLTLDFPLRFKWQDRALQNQLSLDANFKTGYIKHNLSLGYDLTLFKTTYLSGYNINGSDNTADVYGPGVTGVIDAYNPVSTGPMTTRFSKAQPRTMKSHGIFLSNLWEFGKKVQMLTAVRYDIYAFQKYDAVKLLEENRESGLYKLPTKFDKTTSTALTYRFGLVYQPVKNVSVYTSFSNLYKPYNKFYSKNTIYYDNKGKVIDAEENGKVFDPKTGYQVELGTRANITDWLEVTASGFYIKQNNNLVYLGEKDVNGTMMKQVAQVGTIASKGGELSLIARPLEGLHLEAGYSFTDVSITKLSNEERLAKSEIEDYKEAEGRQLQWIPKHQVYSLGSYELSKTVLKGLGAHYSLSYSSKRRFNRDHKDFKPTYFDGYAQFDLGLSYKFLNDHLTLGFDVYNVLDTETFQTALGNQPIPNKPRNFMVSLRYKL